MASGVSVDTSDVDSGRSSPGASSDSDAVNTSTSRVYFGPVQSAERRLARARDSLQCTPIRRPIRRHAGPSSLSMEALQSDEGEATSSNEVAAHDISRPDTPLLAEDAFEEPTSALATRVLRAWDNPSPPPSPHSSPRGLPTDEDDIHVALNLRAPSADSDIDIDSNFMQTSVVDANGQDPRVPNSLVEEQTADMDLINFDSFTSPSTDAPVVNLLSATPPRSLQGAPFTVDDLLAPSPLRPPHQTPTTTESHPANMFFETLDPINREDTKSVDEEAQVLIVLADEPKTPPPQSSDAVYIDIQEAPVVDSLLDPGSQTPLRRSTRPRRSASPYFYPLTSSPSKLPDSPSKPKVEVGPARRRRTKTKESDDVLELDEEKDQMSRVIAGVQESPNKIVTNGITSNIERRSATPLATPLAHEKAAQQEPESYQRLGSLSPASTNLLMQLLPSGTGPDSVVVDPVATDPVADEHHETENAALTETSGDLEQPFPSVVDEVLARPSTPLRTSAPPQPPRDVTRTPARRVLISEAIGQSTVSPFKASALPPASSSGTAGPPLGFLGAPVFKPRGPAETIRSPAKRVPIAAAMSSLHPPVKPSTRPASPVKSTHVRSSSEDPIQPAVLKFPRSMSAEPMQPGQTSLGAGETSRKPASTQSIPVRTVQNTVESSSSALNIPPSIQEIDEVGPQGQVPPSKPVTNLRPPTGKIESKIPRPGVKPYVRPTLATSINKIPRPATSLLKKGLPNTSATTGARPMRMVRKVTSKPVEVSSGSDDNTTQPVPGPGPRTIASRSIKPPSAPANDNGTPTLKRKREAEESKASPSGVRPVVLMRKVPPVSRPAAKQSSSPRVARPSPTQSPGPIAIQGKIRMRKVVDKKKPQSPPYSPPKPEPMDIVHSPSAEQARLQPSSQSPTPVTHHTTDVPTDTTNLLQATMPATVPEVTETVQPPMPPSTVSFMPDIEVNPESDVASQGLRRTTRSRKSAQGATDVFGTVAPPRTSFSRRRTIVLSDNSVFSGMTALALKSLTTTNTQRNQKQVAEIQTEVIVKEGKRPDSPTTKVRTSLERQKEEMAQQRQERAQRRARRSAGSDMEAADLSEVGDISMVTVDQDERAPLRHQRGPGEEEDYETPEKPERPAKRTRLDESQGDSSDVKNERRVKWDRGLATTVYLHDTPPNPKRHPNDVVPKRGALAPSAKKLPLDTMGNVLNADTPLVNVRPENIVVKKFVYEDDEPPAPDPPPAPAPKPTRSKTKKSRT